MKIIFDFILMIFCYLKYFFSVIFSVIFLCLPQTNIFAQDSNISFSKQELLAVSEDVEYYFLDSGDIDNDGDIDIVVNYGYFNQENNYVVWMENNGDGTFRQQQIIAQNQLYYNEILLSDIDNDSDLDLLTTAHYSFTDKSEIAFNENLGDGNFSNAMIIDTSMHYPYWINSADINGDSFKDIIVASWTEVSLFKNTDDNNFESKVLISETLYSPSDLLFFDLDNDGDKDLFVSYYEFGLFFHENFDDSLSKEGQQIAPSINMVSGITLGDLDLDGDLDIILSSEALDGTISWLKNTDDFFENDYQVIATYEDLRTCDIAYLIDLDDDGLDDIIAFSFESVGKNMSWFPGLGNGEFGDQIIIEGATRFSKDWVVDDLNMDGLPDIVEASTSGIYWYKNHRVTTSNEINSNDNLSNKLELV